MFKRILFVFTMPEFWFLMVVEAMLIASWYVS